MDGILILPMEPDVLRTGFGATGRTVVFVGSGVLEVVDVVVGSSTSAGRKGRTVVVVVVSGTVIVSLLGSLPQATSVADSVRMSSNFFIIG